MKKLLMRIARSRTGGTLAYAAIRYCSGLIPVRFLVRGGAAVMFMHPAPVSSGHMVVVPRRRVRDLRELLVHPACFEEVTDFLCRHVDMKTHYLVSNLGARQEVGQLHFHVLERASAPTRQRMICSGDGWAVYDGGRCVIMAERMRELSVLSEATERALRLFPDGMSVIWR